MICRLGIVTVFLAFVLLSNIFTVGETVIASNDYVSLEEIASASTTLGNYLDQWRFLPTSIKIGNKSVSISQYLWISARAILNIHYADSQGLLYPPSVLSPSEMYAHLEFDDSAYGAIFEEKEYIDIVEEIVSLDNNLNFEKLHTISGNLRFVDVAYFVAQILRFYDLFSYLPSFIEIQVISPKNLFPWDTPQELGNFTSSLNECWNWESATQVQFYSNCATDYDVIKFALAIVDDTNDAYEAAKRIYSYIKEDNWLYSGAPPSNVGYSINEWLKVPYHTSSIPHYKFGSLFKAIGIPTRTPGGTYCQVFIKGRGWIEAGTHVGSFGEQELANYRYDQPDKIIRLPNNDNVVIQGIKQMNEIGNSLSSDSASNNSALVNPDDVENLGVDRFVERIVACGIDSVFVTVKDMKGRLYFNSKLYSDRVEKDVLGSLIPKLSQRGVKTYAAFEGLFDPYAASINPNWVEVDWQGDSLFNTISPCIEEYRYYLRDIISEVAQQYPVAGILLRDITFYSLASGFNQVDISTFEEETGKKIEDEVNFETRTIGADFQKWKQTVEDSYLIFLNQQVHAIRSDIEFIYAHMPIPCGWDPLWSNIYRTDTFSTGYWHLPQRIANISKTVDRVMLVYCSNFWLNPIKSQLYRDLFDVPDGAYSAFDLFRMHLKDTVDGITSVNGKLMVSIQITDEWPFSPEFYNVTNRLFKSFSVDWICYYNPAASIGDEGSSASPFLWETIDKIAVALVTPTSATVSPSSSSSSPDPTGGLLEFISQETVYPIIIAGILMITVAITILAIKRRRR